MLGARIVVAVLGIPLLLAVAVLGGWWLTLLVSGITWIGLLEFYRLAARMDMKPLIPAGVLGGLTLVFAAYTSKELAGWLGVALTLAILLLFLIRFPRLRLADAAITLFGIWYIGGLMAFVPLIRELPGGAGMLIMTFLFTWIYDSGAFFCGRLFGRRHPWPQLSPKKTGAGVIGGIVATVVLALALGPLLLPSPSNWLLAGLGLLAAVAAQTGDLIASGLKRQAGVKDSGWLLPGHGGILDRFDSLLLVAPVIYYYLTCFLLTGE